VKKRSNASRPRVRTQIRVPAVVARAWRRLSRAERDLLLAHAATAAADAAERPAAFLAEVGRGSADLPLEGQARLDIYIPPALRRALADAEARGVRPWMIFFAALLRMAETPAPRSAPERETRDKRPPAFVLQPKTESDKT